MTFDSNRAWQDAVAAVRANREVLLALAGVFFLLPTLLQTMFLSDVQTRMMQNLSKQDVLDKLVQDNLGLLLGFGFGGLAVQLVGYVAIMALLSDRGRPTVGQSIATGLRGLPTLVAAGLLCLLAALVISTLISAVIGGLFSVIGAPMIGAGLALVALLALFGYAWVKFSLVMPLVVNERVLNPVAALARSWRLTHGNSLRLFGFYSMLTIAYMAIALLTTFIVLGPVLFLLGPGQGGLLATGLVSGAITAVANVLATAVLAQVHRQLSGTPEQAVLPFE